MVAGSELALVRLDFELAGASMAYMLVPLSLSFKPTVLAGKLKGRLYVSYAQSNKVYIRSSSDHFDHTTRARNVLCSTKVLPAHHQDGLQ